MPNIVWNARYGPSRILKKIGGLGHIRMIQSSLSSATKPKRNRWTHLLRDCCGEKMKYRIIGG